MERFVKVSILLATTLILGGCLSTDEDNLKPEISAPEQSKEIKTIYLPIGGFTSGFIYCGFDGDKSILDEMLSEGWEIKNITRQNFQTSKRNGDVVLCSGNSYLLER